MCQAGSASFFIQPFQGVKPLKAGMVEFSPITTNASLPISVILLINSKDWVGVQRALGRDHRGGPE